MTLGKLTAQIGSCLLVDLPNVFIGENLCEIDRICVSGGSLILSGGNKAI